MSIDFQGAKITSDTGFLLMREMDQRFNILALAYSIGKSYGFGGFRSVSDVFQARIRSQDAVWMPSGEVDALFLFTLFFGIGSPRLELTLCSRMELKEFSNCPGLTAIKRAGFSQWFFSTFPQLIDSKLLDLYPLMCLPALQKSR
jgi:hypothetical protein